MKNFVITLDGPAASGKGTLAKKIAQHYSMAYLDTGLTYRFVAFLLLQQKPDLQENILVEKEILPLICQLANESDFSTMNAEILANHLIGNLASKLAVFKELRHILVKKQQQFIKKNPYCVLDGRDAGTVIYPQAMIKFFIEADVAIRAQRRYDQEKEKNSSLSYEEILEDLKSRDKRDKERIESPLKPAEDAHLLNTSQMSIIEAFDYIKNIIDPIWDKQKKELSSFEK